jgi:hypothetical protein
LDPGDALEALSSEESAALFLAVAAGARAQEQVPLLLCLALHPLSPALQVLERVLGPQWPVHCLLSLDLREAEETPQVLSLGYWRNRRCCSR